MFLGLDIGVIMFNNPMRLNPRQNLCWKLCCSLFCPFFLSPLMTQKIYLIFYYELKNDKINILLWIFRTNVAMWSTQRHCRRISIQQLANSKKPHVDETGLWGTQKKHKIFLLVFHFSLNRDKKLCFSLDLLNIFAFFWVFFSLLSFHLKVSKFCFFNFSSSVQKRKKSFLNFPCMHLIVNDNVSQCLSFFLFSFTGKDEFRWSSP